MDWRTFIGSLAMGTLAGPIVASAQYITLLEAGKRESPSLPVLRRLAKALGVPVTKLLA